MAKRWSFQWSDRVDDGDHGFSLICGLVFSFLTGVSFFIDFLATVESVGLE